MFSNVNVTRYAAEMSKMTDLWLSGMLFQALRTKSRFRSGARRAYDAPRDPLVGWGEDTPLPIPFPRRLRRLDLGTFGASVVRPPTQIPGYAYGAESIQCISGSVSGRASRPPNSPIWNYDVKSKIRFRPLMRIHVKNIPVKFPPDPIWNDAALGPIHV